MKKQILILVLIIIFSTAFAAGCSSKVSSTAAVTGTAGLSSSSQTSSPSATPIPTTAPEPTPSTTSLDVDDDSKATTYNGWIYYLDINDPIATNFSEDPPLHMKKTDNTGDTELGIRGFNFDIIGNYLYVDSNDPDVDENGNQTWSTTRVSLDGSEKKRLEYGSMSERLVSQGDQKFYFTTMGDSAVYVSDFACENVTTLAVNLPDQSDLDRKLDKNKTLQMDISDATNGVITFTASYLSQNGTQLYNGTYKINTDGSSIQKVKGTYYYYSQEND